MLKWFFFELIQFMDKFLVALNLLISWTFVFINELKIINFTTTTRGYHELTAIVKHCCWCCLIADLGAVKLIGFYGLIGQRKQIFCALLTFV